MTDWTEFAEALAEMRESFRAMVAGLVEDGFTDREAHEMVAALVRAQSPGEHG